MSTAETTGWKPATAPVREPGRTATRVSAAWAWARQLFGLPAWLRRIVVRSLVLFASWLLVSLVSMAIIPMLAVWLHQEARIGQMELTAAGTLGMWVMPLLFITLMAAAATWALIRTMWSASGRYLERAAQRDREAADIQDEDEGTGKVPAPSSTSKTKKKNSRRSTR